MLIRDFDSTEFIRMLCCECEIGVSNGISNGVSSVFLMVYLFQNFWLFAGSAGPYCLPYTCVTHRTFSTRLILSFSSIYCYCSGSPLH